MAKKQINTIKDIDNVWEFVAWLINLAAKNKLMTLFVVVVLVMLLSGFSIKTPFWEYEQPPIKVEVEGVGAINKGAKK